MNRFLLFLSAISIGSISNLCAQNSMFDLGLEGGPNLSTVNITSPIFKVNSKPIVYGSGGFIFQYNFKNFLSIKTGFSYQAKGYQVKDLLFTDASGTTISTGTMSTRLDYITFPVLVKASFGKKTQFFVNSGPYAGYLIRQTNRLKVGSQTEQSVMDMDKSGLNRWDFGVAGGIGIAIPIRTFWVITVEARNYTGLLDIAESSNAKWLTNTTDLRVGVAYKLGFYKDE